MSESPLSHPRFFGLKRQFLLLITGVYVLTGTVALGLFGWGIYGITQRLAEDFATQYALRQKSRLLAPIQREIVLAELLAHSPLIQRWVRHEDDPELKAAALAELDNYRQHFADHSYFVALDRSRHFYFNDVADAYRGRELRYTLDPNKPEDHWYFASLPKIEDFDLNVDHDQHLNVTKLWVNALIRDDTGKLGLSGTGLTLDYFIAEALREDPEGVATVVIDRAGAIKAYHESAYIDHNTLTKPDAERSTFFRLVATPTEVADLRIQLDRLTAAYASAIVLPLTVEGKPYLAAVAYLEGIQWFVLVLVETTRVYEPWRFLPFAGLLVVSLLALAVAVTALLNRLVLNPLARLHDSAQAIVAGDYRQLATVVAHNEIGELTDVFNGMVQTVCQHTAHLEQLVAERTQALDRSNRELAEAHSHVLDSIRYAQRIQRAILPKPEVLARALGEHFVIWQPRDLVGGDFYYCQADQHGCLLVVADCTGHGVPGAFMTMAVNSVLNHVTGTLGTDDPARLLQAVNRVLRTTLRQDDLDEGFENGLDAGVCYWQLSAPTLVFAGARLDLYYRDADGTVMTLRGDHRNLGYRHSDPDWTFTAHTVERLPGRIFYLTTDGVLDQSGGPKGYGFGRRRFQAFLQHHGEQPLVMQRIALEQALATWQGERMQRDDMMVIGFQPALKWLEAPEENRL